MFVYKLFNMNRHKNKTILLFFHLLCAHLQIEFLVFNKFKYLLFSLRFYTRAKIVSLWCGECKKYPTNCCLLCHFSPINPSNQCFQITFWRIFNESITFFFTKKQWLKSFQLAKHIIKLKLSESSQRKNVIFIRFI